jgi:hypothetical protein
MPKALRLAWTALYLHPTRRAISLSGTLPNNFKNSAGHGGTIGTTGIPSRRRVPATAERVRPVRLAISGSVNLPKSCNSHRSHHFAALNRRPFRLRADHNIRRVPATRCKSCAVFASANRFAALANDFETRLIL